MSVHAGRERGNFVGELRQWRGVALGELADAPGESLRESVKFTLHSGSQSTQPFVIHYEHLNFVLGQLRVARCDFFGESVLRLGQLVGSGAFFFHECEVLLECFDFVCRLGIAFDFPEPGGDTGLGELPFVVAGIR